MAIYQTRLQYVMQESWASTEKVTLNKCCQKFECYALKREVRVTKMTKLDDHTSMSHTHLIHPQMIILRIKGNDDHINWNGKAFNKSF